MIFDAMLGELNFVIDETTPSIPSAVRCADAVTDRIC
jgi:hypothetical protein